MWDQRFEELRVFAALPGVGKANVPQGDPERPVLGTWCNTQARPLSPVTQSDSTGQVLYVDGAQIVGDQYQHML